MKSFIISLVIAAALIGSSIMHLNKLIKVSHTLAQINSEAAEYIALGDTNNAEKSIARMDRELKKFEPFAMAMGNHEETDNIHTALAELRVYTSHGFIADALAKSQQLDYLFLHLPDNSRIRLENIL